MSGLFPGLHRVRKEEHAAFKDMSLVTEDEPPPAASVAPTQCAACGIQREDWTFEVTDLKAFAQAHPDLVEITVRRADVLKMIRGGCRQLAHARIYTETKVGVRV